MAYQQQYFAEAQQIWEAHVPATGQSLTVEGELIRAIERLRWEAQHNGNANWDLGFSLFCDFILAKICDSSLFDSHSIKQIQQDVKLISNPLQPYCADDVFDRLSDYAVEWRRFHNGSVEREIDQRQYR